MQLLQLLHWKEHRADFYQILQEDPMAFHEDDGEISLSFLALSKRVDTNKSDCEATSSSYVTNQALRSRLKELHPSFEEVSWSVFLKK